MLNLLKSALLVSALALGSSLPALAQTQTKTQTAPSVKAPDWTSSYSITPEGGMQVGNPKAKVHLIEYSSLTCPHCKDFHLSAMAALKSNYIASGKVRYEVRSMALNGPDTVAILISRCQGPQRFFALAELLYRNQMEWIKGYSRLTEADTASLRTMPTDQSLRFMAERSGFTSFLQKRGIPQATVQRCLSDPAALDRIAAIAKTGQDKFNVAGTPTFVLNGKKLDKIILWSQLEPELRKAGA
jgi:protein-disulfide isomerase